MIKFLIKVYCFLRGHDWLETGAHENHRSKFGEYTCARCDRMHNWQYDLH